ncbi:MAG: hypothetical protein GX282_04320 [Campylobacteraceae bacterium]|nr:hypothetical protein [Campylobacteraceae bacterium]
MKKFLYEFAYGMFSVSDEPVLFKDLLDANRLFNANRLVDPGRLNFQFRYAKSHVMFGVFCLFLLAPLIALSHIFFSELDIHITIFVVVFATAAVFISFDLFKVWARKKLTQKLIKDAWEVHFPYFPYEKYSNKVDEIYQSARKKDLPKRDLEKYILDSLVKTS